jgi:hypothetical protein
MTALAKSPAPRRLLAKQIGGFGRVWHDAAGLTDYPRFVQ